MVAPNQAPLPGYGPAVVSAQPVPGSGLGYMGPPGLEYLAMVDHLLIKQKVELLEAFTGWESKNKYQITNTLGQDVFFAKEDSGCLTRMCCGPGRPFEMEIVDNSGREIIHLVRPLRCQGCCFPCCLQVILTTLSVDQIVLIDIDIDVDTYRICCKKSIKSISNNLGLL